MIPAVRDGLESLSAYLAPQVEAPVRLNTNECAVPLPEGFVEDLARAVARIPLNRYPDREARALRSGLSDATGHAAEGIWVANGSNEVLQHLCLAYGGPGRTALVFDPTYSMHALIPRMVGTSLLRRRLGPGFVLPDEVPEASIVFACSPNNPTGNAQPSDAVERLCVAAPASLVVVDEAYVEFGGRTAQPLLERFDNLVVVRTFSKAFSLAGLRLGYCLAAPALLEALVKVRLPYHLSALTQAAGLVALRHLAAARAVLDGLRGQRDRILETLPTIEGVEAFPSDANFVLFRSDVDAGALWRALVARGVLVRDVSAAAGLERCLRVTAGTPRETGAFLDALPAALEEVRA